MAQDLTGGVGSASPNRAPASKVLAGALANQRVANAIITAISGYAIPSIIIATNVSTTIDFGGLVVGDRVVYIAATQPGVYTAADQATFYTVATAGTLPAAAVVGGMYIVLRAVNLDSNNPVVPAGGDLTGNSSSEF